MVDCSTFKMSLDDPADSPAPSVDHMPRLGLFGRAGPSRAYRSTGHAVLQHLSPEGRQRAPWRCAQNSRSIRLLPTWFANDPNGAETG
jgi:hypothetical protein